MLIQTFIFNWRGQYEKTKEKQKQLSAIGIVPVVINSDDNHREDDPNWHNIGEDSYFTAQFLKAIELFDGDALFHIQADASYDDWASIYKGAKDCFDTYNWGIYAPNVDYTWYDASRTNLSTFDLEEPNLKMVANTDCTCWFIHKDIINEAKRRGIDFSPYKMGWSFDIVYPAISYICKRPVIRDYAYTIDHPPGTNYNKDQAEKEMHALYSTLDDEVKEAFKYVKTDINKLAEYYVEKEMNVAIVSCHNPNYQILADLTWDKNKRLYAERYGYSAEVKVWNSRGIPPGWEKMIHVKELFTDPTKKIDWAWVTGCDSLITNFDKPITDIIDNNYHFIIAEDINEMNADSFLIRNSPEGNQYLDALIEKSFEVEYMNQPPQGHGRFEQGAMVDTYEKWKHLIKVVPQRTFNSYDYSYLPWQPPQLDKTGHHGNWMQGDLLIHFPAMTLHRRIKYVEHYMNCITGVGNPLMM